MSRETSSVPYLPQCELDSMEAADREADRVRRELDWSLGAFGAFFSESLDEVLLVRLGLYAQQNPWSLPGGAVTDGEAPSHAVARELTEEAGVAFEEGTLRFAGWFARPWFRPWRRPEKPGELILLFAGLANPLDPALRPNPPETMAADFVPCAIDRLLFASTLSLELGEHPQAGIRKHWCFWSILGQQAMQDQLMPPLLWEYPNRESMALPPWRPVDAHVAKSFKTTKPRQQQDELGLTGFKTS